MKIELRKWEIGDLDNLLAYANNKRIADHLSDAFPHPFNTSDGEGFIQRVSKEKPSKVFAICLGKGAIGSIGIFPENDIYRKNAELAYWLAEEYWNKGIMTKAIKDNTLYAFKQFDIYRIYARPFSSNKASNRVLEKSHFRQEAHLKKSVYKNGKFLDQNIYSIYRDDVS